MLRREKHGIVILKVWGFLVLHSVVDVQLWAVFQSIPYCRQLPFIGRGSVAAEKVYGYDSIFKLQRK